jgi:hydroxymethylpyrimidine kinase/phosphomethylpyrimidine kinase
LTPDVCAVYDEGVNTSTQLGHSELPVVLTIAGSDSGGGAGIQADLKTFAALHVFGTSALTCVTAQTPAGVRAIEALPTTIVSDQIRAVSDGFPIAAAKTGMLYSREIILQVARADVSQGLPILVVDPVMVASSGARLLKADAIDALRDELLPLARVITPNLHEAEILCGHTISTVEELRQAAREIGEKYDTACVAKGGHLEGERVIDVLWDEGEFYTFDGPRVNAKETHGAGCCFSAALTAFLARGELMARAVELSKLFVSTALENAPRLGHHYPLHFAAAGQTLAQMMAPLMGTPAPEE